VNSSAPAVIAFFQYETGPEKLMREIIEKALAETVKTQVLAPIRAWTGSTFPLSAISESQSRKEIPLLYLDRKI